MERADRPVAGERARRFNELKRDIGVISQRMLSLTLRGLKRDGLVTRTVFPVVPTRVDHAPTDLGRSLWPPIEALGAWAQRHHPLIAAAQRRYDAGPLSPELDEADDRLWASR